MQKLEFTLSDCSTNSSPPDKISLSPEEFLKQLKNLLLEDMTNDEQIFDWIEVRMSFHTKFFSEANMEFHIF